MGVRGELFSTKVSLQNRTYFFNVKENRLGDLYLNIVESKNREEGGFERQSVILFAEDLQEFLLGFDESLQVLEKAVRDKRRGTPNKAIRSAQSDRRPRSYKPKESDGRPKDGRFKDGGFKENRSKDPRAKDGRFKDNRFKDDRSKDPRAKDSRFKGSRDKDRGKTAPQKRKVVVRSGKAFKFNKE